MSCCTKIACCAVLLTCLLASSQPSPPQDLDFESVAEAVDYAKKKFAGEPEEDDDRAWSFPGYAGSEREPNPSATWAAVVVKYTYSDKNRKSASMRIRAYSRNAKNNLKPRVARLFFIYVDPRNVEFHLTHPGYHQVHRSVDVAQGEVAVIDDLVLERVTKENGAEVTGRLWLEEAEDLAGIKVGLASQSARTGKKGEFHFSGIPSGEANLHAQKAGYLIPHVRINVDRGSRKTAVIKGYLKRSARVRWAFQPETSRDLAEGLESGETIIGQKDHGSLSFADGFAEARGRNDFSIRQQEDELVIQHHGGPKGAGFIRLADITFGDVLQAPPVNYERGQASLRDGDVFVFKTHDGEHYGKLEVLEVIAGQKSHERALSDLARQPLE